MIKINIKLRTLMVITILICFTVGNTFFCTGCKSKNDLGASNETDTNHSNGGESSTDNDSTIPNYIDGSIQLMDTDDLKNLYEIDYEITHRMCYFKIPGFVEMLVDDPSANDYLSGIAEKSTNETPNTMALKDYIVRYNIPKDKFVEALEENIRARINLGLDLTLEENELPNADIIYTFDDTIISEYYRRK